LSAVSIPRCKPAAYWGAVARYRITLPLANPRQLVLGTPTEPSVQILEFTREQDRVTVAGAVRLTGQSRGGVRDHLKALTKGRHLVPRGAWYGLT